MNQCHWWSSLFTLEYLWINVIEGHVSLPWDIYESMSLRVMSLTLGYLWIVIEGHVSLPWDNLWINVIEGHVSLPWDSYESMSLRVMSLYPGLSMNLSLRVMSLYPGISMTKCHWGSWFVTQEYPCFMTCNTIIQFCCYMACNMHLLHIPACIDHLSLLRPSYFIITWTLISGHSIKGRWTFNRHQNKEEEILVIFGKEWWILT